MSEHTITHYPSPTPVHEGCLEEIARQWRAGELTEDNARRLMQMAYPVCVLHDLPVVTYWPGPMCITCVQKQQASKAEIVDLSLPGGNRDG